MKENKISSRFRRQLKTELADWQEEGLVGADQAGLISEKYSLGDLTGESRGTLLAVIYVIGVVCVGAAVVSFVAAHWDAMDKSLKAALIIGVMLVAHIVGFYLWQISGKSPRLGHALVLLGTLIFGANIGLLAQIFHIKGDLYNAFFAWSLGAVVMACAIGSVPNAVVAIITSFVWFAGEFDWGDGGELWFYPFVLALVFLPFAYLRRSVLVYVLMLLALCLSIPMCASGADWHPVFFLVSAAALATGALIFCYGVFCGGSEKTGLFSSPAIAVGAIMTAGFVYLLSFRELADEFSKGAFSHPSADTGSLFYVAPAIAAAILALCLLPAALSRIRKVSLKIVCCIIVLPLVPLVAGAIARDEGLMVIVNNVVLLVLAGSFVWASFPLQDRRAFWAGVLLVALMIASRFFEYEMHLLIKSAVFLVCGIGVIAVGVLFEKYLRDRRSLS